MSSPPPEAPVVRVGVLGYGALGQHLVARLLEPPAPGARRYELAWVWARDALKLRALPPQLILHDLADAARSHVDLVVEVAHADVITAAGAAILGAGVDLLVGSPTALADAALEAALRGAAPRGGRARLLVVYGALWGAGDIARLGDAGRVAALTVEMRKHPASLAGVRGRLAEALAAGPPPGGGAWTLYDGPVRALAAHAPSNVNTMAAAALAVPELGFDGVRGVLVADAALSAHVIIVTLEGPRGPGGAPGLAVRTERVAPAPPGAVTSSATLGSFWASVKVAIEGCGRGGGGGVVLV